MKPGVFSQLYEQHWFSGNFQWQDGYGAFSYNRVQIDDVYRYIARQEEHHRKKSFKEDYIQILKEEHVDFEERFLFHFFDSADNPGL